MDHLPIVDLRASADAVAHAIGEACREHGFFYVVGHGVDESLRPASRSLSRAFFALPEATKAAATRWPLGGRAWRGYFPRRRRADLRHGRTRRKASTSAPSCRDDASARPRRHAAARPQPLPGDDCAGLSRGGARVHGRASPRSATALMAGHRRSASACRADYFADRCTAEPLILFRIFNYPPPVPRPRRALGRRRAHRLRPADDPAAGRRRRPAGEVARAAGSRRRRCRARSSATSATCSTA